MRNSMKNNSIFAIILLSLGLFLAGCSGDDSPKCSNADNVNDPECQKQIPDIDERPVSLEVIFKDSYYYDQNTAEWVLISKDNLNGGIIRNVVPIYSNFLNVSAQDAVNRVILSEDQYNRQEAYAQSDYVLIPYIEVAYEDGVDYIYNYVKRNLNNQIVFEKTGQMIISNGRAFLPLVNAMFDGQFYSSNAEIGSRFIHGISIAAQSKNKKGARTLNVEFESILQIPNTDFRVGYSDSVKDFNLKDRFDYYFKNNIDFSPNNQFKFFTLEEIKDISEQVPLDVRVVFQEPPKLDLRQELFFELPLDLDSLKSTGAVVPSRGNAFYVKSQELDSDTDFKMRIRMNGQFVTIANQREFIVSNLPAGTPWDMEFFYDFTQNAAYTSNSGKPLITPLKPVCNEIRGTQFEPLQERDEREAAIASGGFISVCHPNENQKIIIPQDQISTTPYELTDTWFDFFSYVPYNPFANELGHFYGLRRVTFKAEGCVRVYVRQPGTTAWNLKSATSDVCSVEGEENSEGWVYFYAERSVTIFDNLAEYEGITGLKSLMQFFGSRPVRQTPHFKFNGDVNETNHIY